MKMKMAFPWMHGPISRQDSERLLANKPDGTYLIRESTNFPGDYTLCIAFKEKVEYYRIYQKTPGKYTCDYVEFFDNLFQLISHYERDADGLFHRLTTPAEREQDQGDSDERNVIAKNRKLSENLHVYENVDTHADGRPATVQYIYEPKHEDELALPEVGALLTVLSTETVDPGWYFGELNGKKGFFPDIFVSFVEANESENLRLSRRGHKATARFSYIPMFDDELTLNVGDVIKVIDEVGDGWMKGSRNGKVGLFPSNYVVFKESSEVNEGVGASTCSECHKEYSKERLNHCATCFYDRTAMSQICTECWVSKHNGHERQSEENDLVPEQTMVRAVCAYEGYYANELSFNISDLIELISKDVSDGWWLGRIRQRDGLFPSNCVQVI